MSGYAATPPPQPRDSAALQEAIALGRLALGAQVTTTPATTRALAQGGLA